MLFIQIIGINLIFDDNWKTLIVGNIIGLIIHIIFMKKRTYNNEFIISRHYSVRSTISILIKYIEFPKYMTVSAISNTLSNSWLMILVMFSLEDAIIGALFMATKILSMPIKLISANLAHINSSI